MNAFQKMKSSWSRLVTPVLGIRPVPYLVLWVAAMSLPLAQAQIKVGANQGTLNGNAILEVESSDKGLLVPRVALSSTSSASPLTAHVAGMVVYNTATVSDVTPGLYQNDGSKWLTVRPASAPCSCGDIKEGLQTANHGDWKLMNGTSYTGSCGTFAINATGAILVQGGTVGTAGAASILVQNQLPNVTPSVTLTAVSAGTPSGTVAVANATSGVQNAGSHFHSITVDGFHNGGNYGRIGAGTSSGPFSVTTQSAGDHNHAMNAHNHGASFSGTALSPHGHSATVSSINGGVTPSPLTTNNLPRLNVNYFVCVN
jgi:hypothetical protein